MAIWNVISHPSGIFLCWKQQIRQLVFTLHKVILSICYSFVYVCEEASQLFTGLHVSSHDDQQGISGYAYFFRVKSGEEV
jgi:hypothetical protein